MNYASRFVLFIFILKNKLLVVPFISKIYLMQQIKYKQIKHLIKFISFNVKIKLILTHF